jgi:hypothetical protein
MIQRFAALLCLFSGGMHAAALPFFEHVGTFFHSSGGQLVEVSTDKLKIGAMVLEWRGPTGGILAGENPRAV